MPPKALLHGAKGAKFLEDRGIFFFAGLAQPEADPSSGGVLARKTLLKLFCSTFQGKIIETTQQNMIE
jgi:hypothetical protein